jgi:outer membrane cobalamin receptor
MIDHVELRAIEQVDRFRVELAPFFKHTTGTVRASIDPLAMGKLVNIGKLNLYGIDVMGRVRVERRVELGGAYDYIKGTSDTAGTDPIDRLPHHRLEGWVQATPDPRLAVLARVRYFGESVDKGTRVPGYTLLEGSISSAITKQYLGVLRVEDLLNLRPETRAGYHTAGRVITLVIQGSWE